MITDSQLLVHFLTMDSRVSFDFLLLLGKQLHGWMDPHDFGLLDPHPESAFQMRIPDADADSG